jgi:hypothetical protein
MTKSSNQLLATPMQMVEISNQVAAGPEYMNMGKMSKCSGFSDQQVIAVIDEVLDILGENNHLALMVQKTEKVARSA